MSGEGISGLCGSDPRGEPTGRGPQRRPRAPGRAATHPQSASHQAAQPVACSLAGTDLGRRKRALKATAAEKALHTLTPATATDQDRATRRRPHRRRPALRPPARRQHRHDEACTRRARHIAHRHRRGRPVLAARVLAGTRDQRRFPTAAAYANYTGTAAVQLASSDYNRYLLSRNGNRDPNSALHSIAVVQIRTRTSSGRRYYDRKIAEGKTSREAIRCLKRHLATVLWKRLMNDARSRDVTPTTQYSAAA
ncbi:transposase [Nocardia sp. NPDC004750]